MPRFSFFHFFSGKCRVGLATRDEPMIYPWRTHDYPVTTRDISKKTRDFRGKPGNVQPVIYPWQTPWFTRDDPWFFHGFECAPNTLKIFGEFMLDENSQYPFWTSKKGIVFQNSDCESKKVWEGKPVFLEKTGFFPQNLVFRGEPRFY